MSTLHYPGDIELDTTQTLGPDMYGGMWAPTECYIDDTGTTMTLRPIPPSELTERAKERLANAEKAENLRALFGGEA